VVGEQALSQGEGEDADVLLVDFVHLRNETPLDEINTDNFRIKGQGAHHLTGEFHFKKTDLLTNQPHREDAFHAGDGRVNAGTVVIGQTVSYAATASP